MTSKAKKLIGLTILFIFLIYILFSFLLIHQNDSRNRKIIGNLQNEFSLNQSNYENLFTEIFPETADCYLNSNYDETYCEEATRDKIDTLLSESLKDNYDNRKPIFFIRLKNENIIQKLYQGGGFKEEVVDTYPEKLAVEILSGQQNAFKYPLYNCCGGNDIVAELPFIKNFLPPRIYLGDFYSEIEYIFLIKNNDQDILGALVYLYGD